MKALAFRSQLRHKRIRKKSKSHYNIPVNRYRLFIVNRSNRKIEDEQLSTLLSQSLNVIC